ncbi:helix-turn-helix domain-containing protein [Aurantibacter crassamenti]|uniref:AraC family transcriptional regulator n=1 Tax=Aurantibacter crassamenti TaxID=1837375 RepID=UPI001939271D|nr:AraC family transcriptional regulator [Aurantibacter crassamenti]MBM1106876.1 helix-turn-helix domain-containing protein [Aurantibacter crassamenti]
MKVHSFEIPKSANNSILVQVDKSKLFYKHLHQHNEIQISYIVKGEGKLIVADSVYGFKPEDIFVIGASTPHLFKSSEQARTSHMISVFFTKDSLGKIFLEIPEMIELKQFFRVSAPSFKLISNNTIAHEMIRKLPNSIGIDKFIHFLKLIQILNKEDSILLTNFIQPKRITKEEGRRMRLVFDFAINNFQTQIKLEEVASIIHLTPNAFCRFFKQRTNKTFFEFVIELRIEHACQLLVNPYNYSMAAIAEMSGFSSVSNFNRKFKRLKGVTPTEFRNNLKFKVLQ